MPDRIAERLLLLAASREDASAIAGDLRELAATRGKFWFWFAVSRTVTNLLWKDLTSAPLFLALLGLRGLLVTVFLGALITFIAFIPVSLLAHSPGSGRRIAFTATWLCTIALVQFVAGLYLAKNSRRREIAAVLAYIGVYNLMRLVGVIVSAALAPTTVKLSFWGVAHAVTNGAFGNGLADQLAVFLKFAPLFLAAILARLRQRESLSSVVRL